MSEDCLENKPLINSSHGEIDRSNNRLAQDHQHVLDRDGQTLEGPDLFLEEDEDDLSEDERNFNVSGHHIDDGHQQTTNTETLIHLIKGNIGTGILAMPDALKNSGLYTGVGLLPFIAGICIHCMHILVNCSAELKQRVGIVHLDYAEVGEQAFKTSSCSALQFLAPIAKNLINVFLIITQMGFCCVYVVFISANIKQVIDCKFPGSAVDIHGYMAIVLLPLLAISMVRSLKVLAPFSLLSNVFLLFGLSICFYYILQDLPMSYNRKEFSSWSQLPLFLGTAIYAFEGIGVVLPLERNMAHREDFRGYNGVLNTAMILVTCGYISVGFYGYLKYGDAVKGSITLNLPPSDNLSQLVKILMASAIYLTYPLMLYVPAHIMWPKLRHKFETSGSRRMGEYGFRALLVFVTLIFAAAIPNIGLFISLVGAVSSSTLAIIFPPIIEIVTFWPNVTRLTMYKCFSFVLFGLFCFMSGTYASITSIIDYFRHSNDTVPTEVC